MVWIVEMVRGNPEEPNFESYDCGKRSWEGFLSLAKKFGWEPAGTVMDDWSAGCRKDYIDWFKPTYDPDEWAYCKCVGGDDAKALAAALSRAESAISAGTFTLTELRGPTIIRDDLTPAASMQINSGVAEELKEFIAFAARGEFTFAWDD